ncbi:hypothetical protein CIRMBP1284_01250 [Enterococcus cecorum]|uniref:MATE family efflux transporter n=1 Tax=Enterococcus cecorum TaxID=44008 RepID=UPI0022CFE9AC|nr:MATE family efflux transporter [Enterococcus cecorum]CAI3355554.1 hypothetical protein CIRMBP1296_00562 [Enterococcus cecorum]CAI3365065.1 hypothetical protein CIRMBP1270_01328 [Enterococcus cecorum]CAI3372996.1 hypothetical protein CIRMBP1284_01250 [Enterococcus cecorum]CAI3416610.1 hypothetical protein CIRMBP1298_01134 [Enterococcus cecorum]CAI3432238.1 hypothetical protein CIRMBP1297_01199 [Enterococcus cecorum]
MEEAVKKRAEIHYRKMTEMPVNKLILSLCVPTVISMLITTIYNAADTYFVSKISVSASGAVGILFSLMAILQAFGFMCGHGSGSWISRLLGAREIERARQYSTTGFAMAFLMGIFFLFFWALVDYAFDAFFREYANYFTLCEKLRFLHINCSPCVYN